MKIHNLPGYITLAGGDWDMNSIVPLIGNVIIPIDAGFLNGGTPIGWFMTEKHGKR